ncbi:hypothetical protein [Paracoccus luteus]|uniref:hypothetical protein n=1 Tax=Paracoccus luteus TaxID=2508543 RepID=UPI00106FEDF8|nr:hypothetical protein [Paracoccus luteus]
MTNATSRRGLLKATPALAFLGALPAGASTGTPVAALFREWRAAQEAEDAGYTAGLPDEELDQLADYRSAIEKRMMATPCETAADFICKVTAHTAFGVFCLPDENQQPGLWKEARALIGGAA